MAGVVVLRPGLGRLLPGERLIAAQSSQSESGARPREAYGRSQQPHLLAAALAGCPAHRHLVSQAYRAVAGRPSARASVALGHGLCGRRGQNRSTSPCHARGEASAVTCAWDCSGPKFEVNEKTRNPGASGREPARAAGTRELPGPVRRAPGRRSQAHLPLPHGLRATRLPSSSTRRLNPALTEVQPSGQLASP